ncbi:TonB-dependent receptor [Ulvibacterium sp.]|uniref:TonB-dependent receptor n=1 Tax=Ulvibacterium sp. TaxID=2665914 RepID=UPI003BAB3171
MKLVSGLFFLFVFSGFPQGTGSSQVLGSDLDLMELVNNIERYNTENPVEKVYLHIDRDITSAGGDLWYTAYVTFGAYHSLSDASKVLYVDLINSSNEVVLSQTQALIAGRCSGSMTVPKELPLGDYRLRAYTKWMTYYDPDFFFYKTLTIVNNQVVSYPASSSNDKINLRFFPEGGQLVNNIPCRVALKAIGNDGLGKKIEGHIIDSTNEFICTIDSTPQGFGIFHLLPQTGNTYRAVLDDGTIYNLPLTIEKGYAMNVNNLDFQKIKIRVSVTDALKNKPFYVIGTSRNQKFFEAKFVWNRDSFLDFEIPKDSLPNGVLTITLFDGNKRPRCERLVFVDNQQRFKVKVTPNTNSFVRREPISFTINVTDQENRPVSTQLSMAITDAAYMEKGKYDRNILTYLLLESDLRGHINNPNFFFKDRERNTLFGLDLIMMTHGWRRYKWQDVLNGTGLSEKKRFEKGITVSGTAYGRNGKPLENTSIKMIGLSDTGFFAYPTQTTDSGHFKIHNIDLRDTMRVTFNAYNSRSKQIDVNISLDENDIFPVGKLDYYSVSGPRKKDIDSFRRTDYTRKERDSIFDAVTELDEVVVTEERIETPESPSMYGVVPDAVIYQDENRLFDLSLLLGDAPGVFVSGSGVDASVSIRGGSPLWVVDGMRLSQKSNAFEFLSPADIERIEILKGSGASIFGASGANGVILVYTRRGKPNPTSQNSGSGSSFEYVLAHDGEREFYSPDYDRPNNGQNKPDHRETLFWDPSVKTDEKGEAIITFFNSDFAKEIQVVVEFLTEQGETGFYMNTFPTDYGY